MSCALLLAHIKGGPAKTKGPKNFFFNLISFLKKFNKVGYTQKLPYIIVEKHTKARGTVGTSLLRQIKEPRVNHDTIMAARLPRS